MIGNDEIPDKSTKNNPSPFENNVLDKLIKISGQSRIVRMQGSATLAIEIMTLNFLYGKILVY